MTLNTLQNRAASSVPSRKPSALSMLILCLLSILYASSCKPANSSGEFDYLYKDLPFEMPVVTRPQIPDRTVDLKDFGGNGNGIDLNTDAFAKAIDFLASKGGGHLNVPAGIWLTGPITLKSCIDLHLEPNAIILFDPDRDLYPIINTVFEGLDTRRCESPVNADGAHDISITGAGVIDGNGDAWRAVKKDKLTAAQWKNLLARGGVVYGDVWYPDEGFVKGQMISDMNVPRGIQSEEEWNEIKSFLRPVMISLRNCENVLLEGCTYQNSPCWNIHPLMCRNMIIKDVTIRNPWYSQNGDGIDIDSCENVIMVDSNLDCGDDGICIKSGKDADGRRRARPCRNLIVDNCTVYHGHGGFTVGSEMSGGVQNIKVSNCRFLGTDVGLRFKSTRGRGGVVSDIYIDDIYMKDIVAEALLFDLYYGGKSAVEVMADGGIPVEEQPKPVDETTPCFRDIHISDIVCNGAARAMFFNGIPEMPVKGVDIDRCTISSEVGVQICWSEDVTLKNTVIVPKTGDPVTVLFSKNVNIR